MLAAGYASVSDFAGVIHGYDSDTSASGSPPPPRPLAGGEASMSAGMCPVLGWLLFRRIVDVPFETCVAALDSWQRTGLDGELRIGDSRLRAPIEHDRDSGTPRIEVRLARGPLRPCCACDWTSTAGPPRPPLSSSSPAGASGPPLPTSAPAISCLTR